MTPGTPEPGKHSSFPEAFHFRHLALPLLSFPLCQLQHHHLLTSKLSWFQQTKSSCFCLAYSATEKILFLPHSTLGHNPVNKWHWGPSPYQKNNSSNQKRLSKESMTCSFHLSFITLPYHSLLKSADNNYLASLRYIHMCICRCAYTYMCIYFPASQGTKDDRAILA